MRFGQQLLQLPVLGLELPQPGDVGHLQAPVLEPPPVECLLGDPIFAAEVLFLDSGLGFLSHPDDLSFTESFPLHDESSLVFVPENSPSTWTVLWGEGQTRR